MRRMLKSFSNTTTRRATSFSLFAGEWLNANLSLAYFILWALFRFDSTASFDPSWRTDVCITENLMENITRCICPISGTFVVLLVKKSFNVSFNIVNCIRNLIILLSNRLCQLNRQAFQWSSLFVVAVVSCNQPLPLLFFCQTSTSADVTSASTLPLCSFVSRLPPQCPSSFWVCWSSYRKWVYKFNWLVYCWKLQKKGLE